MNWFKKRKEKKEKHLKAFEETEEILWNDFIKRAKKTFEENGHLSNELNKEFQEFLENSFTNTDKQYRTNLLIIELYNQNLWNQL